ncbi:MAG: LPXTG cell wall anchor domain-containing protein [Alphaproteobacteria bacterium]
MSALHAFQNPQSNPALIYSSILDNNPDAIAKRLRRMYGVSVVPNPEALDAAIQTLIRTNPQEAKSILFNLLSVQIDLDALLPEYHDYILDANLRMQQGDMGDGEPDVNDLLNELANDDSEGANALADEANNEQAHNQNTPLTWLPYLTPLLGLFGLGKKNPDNTPQTGAKDHTLAYVLVGLLFLGLVAALWAGSKNKKKD